jgi:hypothetical protein
VDCPTSTKLKCPLIIVRYEIGPSGRKVRKEKSLKTNDEKTAWDLINQMLTSGQSTPAEPPKTVQQSIDGFLDLEAKRGIGEATLKSFRKFLCGNPQRNPNGDYSKTLLEFAAEQKPAFQYLKDFTPESVAGFEGSWKVNGRALQVQHERLKQFFKSCCDWKWIPENPAAKLKAPKIILEPVYAFPKEDRNALLQAVAEDDYLLRAQSHNAILGAGPGGRGFLEVTQPAPSCSVPCAIWIWKESSPSGRTGCTLQKQPHG